MQKIGAVNMRIIRRKKRMIELAIGTIFRYDGKLCEVVETAYDHCSECVMECSDCVSLICESENRQDNTEICFKWVEE